MDATLLCNLKGGSRDVALRLRLLHTWLAKPPNSPTAYYHCCLWADQTGMLIQAIADTAMAADIDRALHVGTIYIIKGFGLSIARALYRACSFDLTMQITRTTTFQECTLPAFDFPSDSFEILSFNQLPSRSGYHRILTDIVGRLHSISGVDYQLTNTGSTPKQVLVLQNDMGQRVSVTLWNNLVGTLERDALILADATEPVIIGVGGLIVGRQIGNDYTCSSSSATRIAINPAILEARHLSTYFAGPRSPVAELPIQFVTPEEAVVDAENRTRTVAELLDLHYKGASLDAKHFCSGVIKSVESHSPWYKIQLTLKDQSAEAPFIVFGPCANNLVFTSAPLLAQRYPHRSGHLPPEISALHGQNVKFEAKLPMLESNGKSTGEFRVLRVIPQQTHQIQTPVPLSIQNTVATSQVSMPSQNNDYRDGALVASTMPKLSGSSPSSSSKGKEKVSGPLLIENCKSAFQIGQFVENQLSQTHGPLSINERVASPQSQLVPAVSSGGPLAVSSNVVFAPKQTSEPAAFDHGKPIAADIAGPLQTITDKHVATLKNPATPSLPPEKAISVSMSSPGQVSSTSSCSVVPSSETPQSRIGASPLSTLPISSSTLPFSSPSAFLLVSPLAKVKVEKLDASELKKNDLDAQGSTPFSIGEEGGKRSSVKRRLMPPRKKPTTSKPLKRKRGIGSAATDSFVDMISSFSTIKPENVRIDRRSRRLPLILHDNNKNSSEDHGDSHFADPYRLSTAASSSKNVGASGKSYNNHRQEIFDFEFLAWQVGIDSTISQQVTMLLL
ncbi:unnamed protein product [Linum trigynum]|uniref:Uncharacterized protein n=1 Tax=Linum trigynum TaxID=586398 RepID=A0AAV2G6H4_9ROSI